ncbi:MAG: SDR family NAD(P)-dependent oxidoreductase [Proteobacteria bacterium]|nr:SDR family NAD(P)-dependent oxidoreductase [Pseudomonadota bacterium]
MTPRLVIFGLGYAGQAIASLFTARGWEAIATGRAGQLAFDDDGAVRLAMADASHVLSTVPPDGTGADPVLERYGAALRPGQWLGYLSSTGVYGDCAGAWVDESAAVVGAGASGRRMARAECEAAWLARGARAFRLPGIYGPGRNAFTRLAGGHARRIDAGPQVFSRVHVADIASGVLAAVERQAAPGAWNLADDLPASNNAVIEEACRLAGLPLPPLEPLESAGLSPQARGFYAENRRVANGKARRLLGWSPRYPTYREGLAALLPG